MALVLKDRVRESSTSSGTGSITLAGAFSGYQTFNSVVANGSTVYYTIHNTTVPNDGEWEVGVGTFTSPSTLSRDTVFSSSAGGTTKVSFSGSSTLEVFITQPAEQAVYINDATGKVEVFGNGTNTVTFTNATADLFTGNGSAISAINASNISSGTIANARTTAASANGASTIVTRDAGGNFAAATITATTFSGALSGNGSAISAINASNVSTGTLADARLSSNVATLTATQTFTNKRITPRVSTATSSATPTINTDNVDIFGLTAQAVDITSFTTNLSGTPTNGQKLWIYIVGTASRAITWGASFEDSTVILPTTTNSINRLDVGFVWNAVTSKWRCVAVA